MALKIITGTVGSGKTCLSTFFAFDAYDRDYHIYANYEILGLRYKSLKSFEDLLEIKTYPNMILMDEGWINADSRRSASAMNLLSSHKVLQHRKGMNKKELIKRGHKVENEVVITAQTLGQVDLRMVSVVKDVYETRVIMEDELGKPLCLWVKVLNSPSSLAFPVPMQFKFRRCGLVDVPESFNTFEDIDNLDNSGHNLKVYAQYHEKYKNFPGLKTQLSDILWQVEGLAKSVASGVAGYIIAVRDGLVEASV